MKLRYAIEIQTSTSITDSNIGLTNGVFRFITGGGGPYVNDLLNEDGTSNEASWWLGFLLRDGVGSPSRQIDIRKAGSYGKLSGFDFTLTNHEKIWDSFYTNGVFLLNRRIQLYAVIGQTLYAIWGGAVSKTDYDETALKISCKDVSQSAHRQFPPATFGRNEFEDLQDSREGEPIPVCAGKVPKARVYPVVENGKSYYVASLYPINFISGGAYGVIKEPMRQAAISSAVLSVDSNGYDVTTITLADGDMNWVEEGVGADGFTNKFVYFRNGVYEGQYARIASNTIYTVTVKGSFPLDNSALYSTGNAITSDTVLVEVVDYTVQGVFSHDEVQAYNASAGYSVPLYAWDGDREAYAAIHNAVKGSGTSGGRNYIDLLGAQQSGGEVVTGVRIPSTNSDRGIYSDVDRGTKWAVGYSAGGAGATDPYKFLDCYIYPGAYNVFTGREVVDFSKYDDVYIAADVDATTASGFRGQLRFKLYYTDIYQNETLEDDAHIVYPESADGELSGAYNFLPNNYYVGGDDNGEESLFDGQQTVRAQAKISANLKTLLDNGAVGKIRIQAYFIPSSLDYGIDLDWAVKEVGLYSTLSYTPENVDSLYTSVQGETLSDGSTTDNVYGLFRMFLEKYDGIPAADIDYTNVEGLRGGWLVGRQFTERKSSKIYIEDLARAAFVGVCPDRQGRRRLRCWLEDTDFSNLSHSETDIIRDSIRSFDETPPELIYNDFYVRYNHDPGLDKFTRGFALTRAWKETFPAVDGVDDEGETWAAYFSGLRSTDYADAKALWERARKGYERANSVQQAPESLTRLDTFIDLGAYTPGGYEGVLNSAFRALSLLVGWTTAPKTEVRYSIPITAANIQAVELLEPLSFTDSIFTNSAARFGWVTGIEYDTARAEIVLTALLKNRDSAELEENLILETGSADMIDETGSNTDIIEETGV